MIIQSHLITPLRNLAIAAVLATPAFAAPQGLIAIPDFTQGATIPADATHDWNLGATGLRGWIFCDKMVTTDALQIAVTQVEKDSPADGILAVGDVLLGVGGKAFSYDPRTEFGKALTLAESEASGGKLLISRWRAGKTEDPGVQSRLHKTFTLIGKAFADATLEMMKPLERP